MADRSIGLVGLPGADGQRRRWQGDTCHWPPEEESDRTDGSCRAAERTGGGGGGKDDEEETKSQEESNMDIIKYTVVYKMHNTMTKVKYDKDPISNSDCMCYLNKRR